MQKKSPLISSAIAMLITLITSLITLLSAEGVGVFADVPLVAYAVAVLGALLGGLKDYQSRLAEPPYMPRTSSADRASNTRPAGKDAQ